MVDDGSRGEATMSQDGVDADGRSLADKLNHLFHTCKPVGRKPYSNADVAKAIRDQGTDISSSYIAALRAGDKTNPTLKHLEGLARFFGVPPAYFFDDATTASIDDQLEQLGSLRELEAALSDDGVRILALKARGLSPSGLQHIERIVDHVRALEQESRRKEKRS
jgi:transcriptional regulator with XRE-family HTH domain